jgi:hypothetical protein
VASTGRRHGLHLRSAVRGAGMSRRLTARLAGLGLPAGPTDPRPVTEADLAPLPEPAQRWMRRSGVVGRPRDWSFRVRTTGRFRLRPGRGWMPFEAWQYDSGPAVARVYCMRVDMAGVLPVYAVDSYVAGRGRMRGRLLGLVPVADGSGPEFDVGELATWVDDAAMTAPSMLLVPAARWTPVDDGCVQLAFTDSGTTVTTRLSVDAAGRLTDVSTEDRYAALPQGVVRARWSTPVAGWTTVDGREIPAGGTAVWHLPDGEYRYAEVRVDTRSLRWGVPPA